MKVLVACEYSGVIRDLFRSKGHDAWSCDLLKSAGDSKYHIRDDVRKVLSKTSIFARGVSAPETWDLLIAHPTTYELTAFLAKAPVPKICIQMPYIPWHASRKTIVPTQIICPSWFGHTSDERILLWLKHLKPLTPEEPCVFDKPMPRAFDISYFGVGLAMVETWG